MAQNINNFTEVTPMVFVEKTYEQRKMLFGLIQTRRLIKETVLEEELQINTTRVPEKVFINNVLYIPKE